MNEKETAGTLKEALTGTDLNKNVSSSGDVLMPETEAVKKPSIIEPISLYTKEEVETYYRNHFDLEGGTFPDLFNSDVPDRKDCLSYVRYVATPRSARMYTNLLNGVIREATASMTSGNISAEERTARIRQVIEEFTKAFSTTRQK